MVDLPANARQLDMSANIIDGPGVLSLSIPNVAGKKELFESVIMDLQRDTGVNFIVGPVQHN